MKQGTARVTQGPRLRECEGSGVTQSCSRCGMQNSKVLRSSILVDKVALQDLQPERPPFPTKEVAAAISEGQSCKHTQDTHRRTEKRG